MKHKFIKIIGFSIILSICGYWICHVLCGKYPDGILQMEYFYNERKDSIDVIFLGSSHTFCNINTKTLWEEYGISSYDLAGSVQPLWNSYFYLKEAIIYQNPKVVVLDVFRAIETREYVDHSRIIKNTFGIASLNNRFTAIHESSPLPRRVHYWLGYPTYHQRYKELSKADFCPQYDAKDYYNEKSLEFSKGFVLFTHTRKNNKPENFISTKSHDLSTKTEEYLYKIIELCKNNNIALFFIVTPYASDNVSHEDYFARIKDIANENAIPFINYNHLYEEIGIDFSLDVADSAHMNFRGSEKFSRYLGNYLKKNYSLPDHRGDLKYLSYEKMCHVLQCKIDNQAVKDSNEIAQFIDTIKRFKNRYIFVLGMKGNCQVILENPCVCEQLEALGISIKQTTNDDCWIIDEDKVCFHAGKESIIDWHMLMKSGFVHVTREGAGKPIKCNLNREMEEFASNGLSIIVFDKEMECIVDRAGFVVHEGKIELKRLLKGTPA